MKEMSRKSFLTEVILLISLSAGYSNPVFYPTHWWTGMKNPALQLIVHAENIATNTITISYPGVKLVTVNRVDNKNYVFLDLMISATAKPGKIKIHFKNKQGGSYSEFELRTKDPGDGRSRIQGVTQADFIYLLMPDRFANGDPSNDFFNEMRDSAHDRTNPFDRHGGDLKGIEDHLDYLKELGVTAIWPTPVVENDMARTTEGGLSRSTYHGYAFTDQYQIDRRLGGNEAYKQLVLAAHAKGLKFIQDAVYNHVGQDHWSIRDLPMKDWINQWPTYTNTSYKEQPILDPYASDADRKIATDGWFTPFLADLNQRNPYVANFLIQYAIWATEEFGIDGWRVDTYFYSDGSFLNKINNVLKTEFPYLSVFGETLVPDVVSGAYFSQNKINTTFSYNCPGITDFPLCNALLDALRQPFGWSTGVSRIYSTLSQDILYRDPTRNCIFLDNHDLDRVYSIIKEDFSKYKMAINWLLTLRGIPQLYYGTEILMKNLKNPTDAEVRQDFPGGWKEDPENKFTKEGRTAAEQAAFSYVSLLANFRKTSSALTKGKLMQYLPREGVYIYFRFTDVQTVMVISNTGTRAVIPDWDFYHQRIQQFTKARNVQTGEVLSLNGFEIQPQESYVVELLN